MRITFLLGHELPFPPQKGGGVNSLVYSLATAMAADGHQITAISPQAYGYSDDEIHEGIHHIRLKSRPRHPNNWKNQALGIPYALKALRIMPETDVLSCHLLSSFLFKPFARAKVVTHTVHRDPKRFLILMSFLDRIYFGSPSVTTDAKISFPYLAQKFKTIYNCADFSLISPTVNPSICPTKFIYVGRFSREKGLDSLIRGFLLACKSWPKIFLSIVGPLAAEQGAEPGFLESMRSLISKNNFSKQIEILEPIYDRRKLLNFIDDHHVACLPSLGGETLNMAIVECLSLAKPVLVSDLAANAPLVIDGENGFVVKSNSPNSWAEKIEQFLRMDSIEYNNFCLSSFKHGKQHFSSTAIARAYIEDFTYLLER